MLREEFRVDRFLLKFFIFCFLTLYIPEINSIWLCVFLLKLDSVGQYLILEFCIDMPK